MQRGKIGLKLGKELIFILVLYFRDKIYSFMEAAILVWSHEPVKVNGLSSPRKGLISHIQIQ